MSHEYQLFLFDLDDTLLDFKASEELCFFHVLSTFHINESDVEALYRDYREINQTLWSDFEKGMTTKEKLKVERFQKLIDLHDLKLEAEKASHLFLEKLPESVVLIEGALELLSWAKERGEVGIITNGISSVQHKRIANSKLHTYIDFVSVSEDCGYAKPDRRFFEYTAKMAKNFEKKHSLIIGDRFDADIVGAHHFQIDACWYNPQELKNQSNITPKYEIRHLSELQSLFA